MFIGRDNEIFMCLNSKSLNLLSVDAPTFSAIEIGRRCDAWPRNALIKESQMVGNRVDFDLIHCAENYGLLREVLYLCKGK